MGEFYGAQFAERGWSDFNNALGRAFEQQAKRKEEAKRGAQLTTSLRKTLDLMRPEGKDVRATQGLPELQGELQFLIMEAAEKEKGYRARESVARTALAEQQLQQLLQEQAQGEAAQRFYGEMDEGMRPPAPLNEEGVAAYRRRGVAPEQVFGALRRSGYAPRPDQLDQLLRALAPAKSLNQIPVEQLGTPRPVQGRDDYLFVPTTTGGGQMIPARPTSAKAEPQEISIGGKATGWALFPDGRYRLLKGKKDEIDAADFDADGDGVINTQEFAQAALAARMKGEVYPGMKVRKEGGGRRQEAGKGKVNPKDPLGLFE